MFALPRVRGCGRRWASVWTVSSGHLGWLGSLGSLRVGAPLAAGAGLEGPAMGRPPLSAAFGRALSLMLNGRDV